MVKRKLFKLVLCRVHVDSLLHVLEAHATSIFKDEMRKTSE
jgi:hypothetical protein